MSKIIFSFLVVFLLAATFTHAEEVDIDLIKKVVETKIIEFNRERFDQFSVTIEPQPYYDDSKDILAYVQQIEPQGFMVISADDELEPVLGYSLTHNFSWDDDPQNLLYHLVRIDMALRKKQLKFKTEGERSRIKEKWNHLVAGTSESRGGEESVWPTPGATSTGGWLETLWHQSDPFNARCPYDNVNSGRSVVGCVATAMGQIINFHQYPSNIGDFSDVDDYTFTSNGFTFSIDDDCGTNGTLTWSQLNPHLNSITYPLSSSSSSGIIDEFCYACGVSVQMKYSAVGSGAYTEDVADALRNRFGYLSAEWLDATDSGFFTTLESNMKNAQPAEMTIKKFDPYAGHAIVVDGFDEVGPGSDDDLYHLNYGWGSLSYCYWWNLLPIHNVDPPLPSDYTYVGGAVVNISSGDGFTVLNQGTDGLEITVITCDKTWLEATPPQALPIILAAGEQFQLDVAVIDWNSVNSPSEDCSVCIYSNDQDENPFCVTVTAYPDQQEYPDLTVFQGPEPDDNPPFQVGQSVDWTATCKNEGQATSGATTLSWFLSSTPTPGGKPLPDSPVSPLDPGDTDVCYRTYTFVAEDEGIRYMIACVDPDNEIEESNETNNCSYYGPFTVTITPPVELTVADAYGAPGDTSMINVEMDNEIGVGGVQSTLVYDGSLITAVCCSTTSRSHHMNIGCNTWTDSIRILLYSASGDSILPGTGPIFRVFFAVDPFAPYGDSGIVCPQNVYISDPDAQPIPFTTECGWFYFGCSKGDLNQDGDVNIFDLVRLVNCVLGKPPACTPWEECAGDVCCPCESPFMGDGELNIFDIVCLVNMILGKTITCAKGSEPGEAIIQVGATSSDMNVQVFNSSPIAGLQMSLSYDPEVLSLGSAQTTSRSDQLQIYSYAADGMMTILLFDPSGGFVQPGSGSLITVPVTIIGSVDQGSSIELHEILLAAGDAVSIPFEILKNKVVISPLPGEYALLQNYPNPCNPATEITYQLPELSRVQLRVYNISGQLVRTLVDQDQQPGTYRVRWDGTEEDGQPVASGIYVYQLKAGSFVSTKKAVLLR